MIYYGLNCTFRCYFVLMVYLLSCREGLVALIPPVVNKVIFHLFLYCSVSFSFSSFISFYFHSSSSSTDFLQEISQFHLFPFVELAVSGFASSLEVMLGNSPVWNPWPLELRAASHTSAFRYHSTPFSWAYHHSFERSYDQSKTLSNWSGEF